MILAIYLFSVIYCISKMYKSYKQRYDDPLYATPALETLAILVMAPVLMTVDVVATWIRKYKESKEDSVF